MIRRKFLHNCLLVMSLVVCSGLANAESSVQTRIVGGENALQGDYPWVVFLSIGGSRCGGTLIDESWVLTAAHCVYDAFGEITAYVGEYDRSISTDSTANPVTKVIIHPDYDTVSSDNDIALLRLKNPETGVTPLALISTTQGAVLELEADDTTPDLTAIGWGGLLADTGDDEGFINQYPRFLQEVELPYISNTVCNAPAALNGQVTNNMMCAGLPAGGIDTCQGDSGGPLIYFDAGSWYQAGVVSWGYGCAQPNKYGVYTRMENYLDWIEQSKAVTPYLHFSTWLPGKTVIKTIEVKNTTDSAFSITTAPVSSNETAFQIGTNTCVINNPINIDEGCTIDIQFVASATGSYAEIITVETDHVILGALNIDVTGKIAAATDLNSVDAGPGLEFVFAGSKNWTESNVTTSGHVLQSGAIGNSQQSSLFTYVNVSASGTRTLHYDWKACSEEYFDYLQLWVDNEPVDALNGDADWRRSSIELEGEGEHVVEWRYAKDYVCSAGLDAGWVANVSLDSTINNLPVHTSSCNIKDIRPQQLPCAEPPSGGGGGSLSWLLLLGLGLPLLVRRKN